MSKDSSKLLIDEPPLQILPTLATKIGLNEAIVIQQVHYWLVIAKKAKNEKNFKDGRWWVYNTYEGWQENFPWWSVPTIKRTFYNLENRKFLISRQMDAQDWNQTKWYTIDYDELNKLVDCIRLTQSEDSDRNNQEGQDDTLLKEPETTSKTTQRGRKPALDFKNMSVSEARKLSTIKLYIDATEQFPGSVLWETVHKTITEKNLTFEQLHSAAVAWIGRGFNPHNTQGILEWAINGIPTNGKTPQPQIAPAVNTAAVEATKQYNDNRWSVPFAPPPADLQKPVLKQPERRVRR